MATFALEPINRRGETLTPVIDQEVLLEERSYRYVLTWTDRQQRWRMDLFDALGVAIWRGRYMPINTPIGLRIKDERKPPGYFMMIDADSSGRECGFEDLGTRCALMYITSDEIIELIGPDPLEPASIQDAA